MKKSKIVNTYIDTLGLRCECDSQKQRDALFNYTFQHLSHI